MFSKFTSILQHAVEALAPSLPLQEDFVYHWKAITHYYIETSDDKAPVTDTNIPSHLEQMLDILIQEENERESGETGPCMEYLLHHKILETLYTLGKADCPPGMKQQVLSFYTKLLGRIRQPLLPHINVHRPVQKLIRLCGEVLTAPTENEEIQFLCIVCAKLKQDPYLVNFFLEVKQDPVLHSYRRQVSSQAAETTLNKSKAGASGSSIPVRESILGKVKEPSASSASDTGQTELTGEPGAATNNETESTEQAAEKSVSVNTLNIPSQSETTAEEPASVNTLNILSQSKTAAEESVSVNTLNIPSQSKTAAEEPASVNTLNIPLQSKTAAEEPASVNTLNIPLQSKTAAEEPASVNTLHLLSQNEAAANCPNQNYNLVNSLLNLTRSPDGRIVVKACEGLMLLVSLPEPAAAKCLTENTALCELLTERLTVFYKALPQSMDPLDIETVESVNWGLDAYSGKEDTTAFPGKRALISFLSWLDYCDQLIKEAQKTAAVTLARYVRERFFVSVMEPQLMQTSEIGILTSTALLNRLIRQVTSGALLQETIYFILGEQREPETLAGINSYPLRHRLIEHCDHLSDEISIMTLRMFEHLLQKPSEHIIYNLVLRNLEERNYTEYKPPCQEDKDVVENGQIAGAIDLEEDPLFTDLSPGNRLSADWLSASLPETPDHTKSDGKTEVHKIVNSFLCLVPDEAKSSYHVEGTGYDTYLRDAHRQFREFCAFCTRWEWPGAAKTFEKCRLDAAFFEGHFLKVLFDRMGRILDQPYDVNLQVTSVLSKLSMFPHPHIHEYLLDPYINLAPGCRSLFSVIVRVVGDLMLRIQRIPDFTPKLLQVRKRLLGMDPEDAVIDHSTLLEGVIVLEEFCKELAAIAFVKFHASTTP
ncbi:protein FAM160B1-like isoform X1 [Acipenser oxyrinchus oxyrinchus]|uniref:Protein FAM160B1-like isoform X1 n=1 Tax=Acipenser oxyrinchus oxyrinchus TaxID=40147 RepID=A0AAD8D839_ACIOX|nr:protein FAM160B1-like isoform X1 [Acipenser oxyrinchus oxyrinchus]